MSEGHTVSFAIVTDEGDEHYGCLAMFVDDDELAAVFTKKDAVRIAEMLLKYAANGSVPRNVFDA